MKHSYFYSFTCSILLLTACSGEKTADAKLPIINIDESTGYFENDYTSEAYKTLLKNPKIVQLETKDDCLLGGLSLFAMSLLNISLWEVIRKSISLMRIAGHSFRR